MRLIFIVLGAMIMFGGSPIINLPEVLAQPTLTELGIRGSGGANDDLINSGEVCSVSGKYTGDLPTGAASLYVFTYSGADPVNDQFVNSYERQNTVSDFTADAATFSFTFVTPTFVTGEVSLQVGVQLSSATGNSNKASGFINYSSCPTGEYSVVSSAPSGYFQHANISS